MTNKRSLLLAADTFHPKVDGTLKFMGEFIKRSQNTFNISLLIPRLDNSSKMESAAYLETSKRISLSGYPLMKLTWKNLKLIKEKVKKADIIFVQGPALISYLSIYYGHKFKKTTIFYTHTIAWELLEKFVPLLFNKLLNKIVKLLSVLSYNRCNLILVPYPGLESYLKQAGVKTSIKVARLGVDINTFTPTADKNQYKTKFGISPDKKVIGYVGRISKEKNTLVLLEAFKQLEPPGRYHLLMVGDGPKDQAEKFSLLKNCTITGFKPDVNDYLKAMDLFVMPSLTETTSLATLEAMATGIPVIVSKVGYIKDYVKKDYNGQFFPKSSPKLLASKISKLLADQELQEKLGRNARKTVIYSFSWDRSINRIKRLILSLPEQK
ncbi:glycosyltransferase [Candidatus Woesearchaeota archaeon]|nr:glycosyltransferase [Candidatus Woesearchaeota archaeon]